MSTVLVEHIRVCTHVHVHAHVHVHGVCTCMYLYINLIGTTDIHVVNLCPN